MKTRILLACTLVLAFNATQANAQNNYFGSSMPSGPPAGAGDPGANSASIHDSTSTMHTPGLGDFSDDEKRMQKKYKREVAHAKQLISKGEDMMRAGEKKHDDKAYKKGKVFKEIGEKNLADLQANNPFPDPIAKQDEEKAKKHKKGKNKDN